MSEVRILYRWSDGAARTRDYEVGESPRECGSIVIDPSRPDEVRALVASPYAQDGQLFGIVLGSVAEWRAACQRTVDLLREAP